MYKSGIEETSLPRQDRKEPTSFMWHRIIW